MTNHLHKRIFEHKSRCVAGFTDMQDIERLSYWESFDEVSKAINLEKQLKALKAFEEIARIESRNPSECI